MLRKLRLRQNKWYSYKKTYILQKEESINNISVPKTKKIKD